MANLKDIRRRIASVKSTQKITNAMKMVAAAKLRKAQERAERFRSYADVMAAILGEVAKDTDADAHPLLVVRPVQRALVLHVSSDRGLCGGFNSNLNRAVARHLDAADHPCDLAVAGRKARQYFEHRRREIRSYFDVVDNPSYEQAAQVAAQLIAWYEEGTYDRIDIAFNRFVSVVSQVPTIVPVLPVRAPEDGMDHKGEAQRVGPAGFIFEPDGPQLLSRLLPAYVEVQLFGALLESQAAEQAARMTAMDTATNNAQDMIDGLTLQYNRARQSAITSELMDIVGGAEALND